MSFWSLHNSEKYYGRFYPKTGRYSLFLPTIYGEAQRKDHHGYFYIHLLDAYFHELLHIIFYKWGEHAWAEKTVVGPCGQALMREVFNDEDRLWSWIELFEENLFPSKN